MSCDPMGSQAACAAMPSRSVMTVHSARSQRVGSPLAWTWPRSCSITTVTGRPGTFRGAAVIWARSGTKVVEPRGRHRGLPRTDTCDVVLAVPAGDTVGPDGELVSGGFGAVEGDGLGGHDASGVSIPAASSGRVATRCWAHAARSTLYVISSMPAGTPPAIDVRVSRGTCRRRHRAPRLRRGPLRARSLGVAWVPPCLPEQVVEPGRLRAVVAESVLQSFDEPGEAVGCELVGAHCS